MPDLIAAVESLRRASLADAPAVSALTRAAYEKWIPIIGREPKPMGADYEQAVLEHIVDVLEIDGELVALIEMIRQDDHLLIENVAVAPEFQGRGFGKMLMAHAETLAASLGYRELCLYTNGMFTENIAIYEKLGYAIFHEEAYRGGIAVHMKKCI